MKNKKILENAKAQGLPINFIILITIAVLVLIMVVIFFTMGFRTDAVGMQSAINACESRCLSEMRYVSSYEATSAGYSNPNSHFCSIAQVVEGYADPVRCDEITGCEVIFRDGSRCMLNCAEGTSTCRD